MPRERTSPPVWSRWLLVWAARRWDLDELVADVEEVWQERCRRTGVRRAAWWYRAQACMAVMGGLSWRFSSADARPAFRTRLGVGRQRWGQALRRVVRARGLGVPFALTLGLGMTATAFMVQVRRSVLSPDLGVRAALWQLSRVDSAGFSTVQFETTWNEVAAFSGGAARVLAVEPRVVSVGDGEGRVQANARVVQPGFLARLGLAPSLGRDATAPGEVVLSRAFWRQRFGSDAAIAGRTIEVDGDAVMVAGVAPATFDGTSCCVRPALWMVAAPSDSAVRAHVFLTELRDSAAAVAALARTLAQRNSIVSVHAAPMRASAFGGERGIVGRSFAVLLVLAMLAFVGTLLNGTNLLLADILDRGTEFRLRRSLGAGRMGVVLQVGVESFWLAALSALVALLGMRLLLAASPFVLPIVGPDSVFDLDAGADALVVVVAATAAAAVLCGVPSGLVASALSSRVQLDRGPGRSRTAAVMLAAQVAVATGLGVIALGFLFGLRSLDGEFVGFRNEDAAVFAFSPAVPGIPGPAADDVVSAVTAGTPARAALSRYMPVYGAPYDSVDIGGSAFHARIEQVGESWFEVVGARILAGRAARSEREAVVSTDFGPLLSASPAALIGATVRIGEDAVRIVGVAESATWGRGTVQPSVYRGWSPVNVDRGLLLVASPDRSARTLATASRSLDATGLAIASWGTLADLLTRSRVLTVFIARLAVLFAGICVAVALAGVYAHVLRWVRARRRDLGIRYALGAPPLRIRRSILAAAVPHVLAGVALGLAASALAIRALGAFWLANPAGSVSVIALAAVAMSCAGLLVALLPAVRPVGRDPVRLLRPD